MEYQSKMAEEGSVALTLAIYNITDVYIRKLKIEVEKNSDFHEQAFIILRH